MGIDEFIGRMIGATIAPFTLLGSLLRGNRLFHPDGVIYRAEVEPIAENGPLGRLAEQLAGTALVRLSGALRGWPQGKHAPDLLGVVVRFRSVDDVTPKSLPGDQDLLLVTAPSLPGLVTGLFRTNVNDFLDNRYYAILPFTLEGLGKVYLRLAPTQKAPAGPDRRERLALAVAEGKATLRLEVRVEEYGEQWLPIAGIDLRERLRIEDRELVFDPGSSAKGLVPRGVLQWLRPVAYAASNFGWRLRRRGPSVVDSP
jgi:hypothetical protein